MLATLARDRGVGLGAVLRRSVLPVMLGVVSDATRCGVASLCRAWRGGVFLACGGDGNKHRRCGHHGYRRGPCCRSRRAPAAGDSRFSMPPRCSHASTLFLYYVRKRAARTGVGGAAAVAVLLSAAVAPRSGANWQSVSATKRRLAFCDDAGVVGVFAGDIVAGGGGSGVVRAGCVLGSGAELLGADLAASTCHGLPARMAVWPHPPPKGSGCGHLCQILPCLRCIGATSHPAGVRFFDSVPTGNRPVADLLPS